MRFIPKTPTRLEIEDYTDKELELLKKTLTFRSKSAQNEYLRFKNNRYWANSLSPEVYTERLEELKSKLNVCLLRGEEEGTYWCHLGLLSQLTQVFRTATVDDLQFEVPAPVGIPWYSGKTPPKLRPYQLEAVEALLKIRHGAVEIGTGLGKSMMILQLCKTLGLKTVIMAPTESIFNQLVKTLEAHLGKRYVGRYGAGQKKLGKLITVGIAASLTKVEPSTPAWDDLSQAQVFIADESHLTPAKTLEVVCVGLCGNAPYRFFFSGTQTRGDGAELLLEGIIGPVVKSMTVREGVDGGWLSKPIFKMYKVPSKSKTLPKDPKRYVQEHFLYNPEVLKKAGLVSNAATSVGKQVLILIEEAEQMQWLMPFLSGDAHFAHGGSLSASAKKGLPAKYHKSDAQDLVNRFNNGEIRVLVGTSCVNTGTDFQPVDVLINLQGGASEIRTRQSIGRGTRKTETKSTCIVVDFLVDVEAARSSDSKDLDMVMRHGLARKAIYNDIYGPVEIL